MIRSSNFLLRAAVTAWCVLGALLMLTSLFLAMALGPGTPEMIKSVALRVLLAMTVWFVVSIAAQVGAVVWKSTAEEADR